MARNFRVTVYLLLIIALLVASYRRSIREGSVEKLIESPLGSMSDVQYIAHALGGLEGRRYLNSFDGFKESYKRGFRVFEVDLEFTADNRLVCFHRRSEGLIGLEGLIKKLPFKEFEELKYFDNFPTLDAKTLIDQLLEYPDIMLVLDTKGDFKSVLSRFVKLAKEANPSLLERTVPQLYGDGLEDLRVAMSLYDFKFAIYTLYRTQASDEEIIKFIKSNPVSAVTFPVESRDDRFVAELQKYNISALVHPVDEQEQAEALFQRGITGIYSSFLSPSSDK